MLQAADCPELVRGLVPRGLHVLVAFLRYAWSSWSGRKELVPFAADGLPLWWNRYSAICWRPSDVHPCSIGFASRPGSRSCRGSNYGRTSSHAVSANIGPRETAAMLSPSGAGDKAVRPPRWATCWSFSRGDQGFESSSSRLSMTSVAFTVDAMSLSDFACIAEPSLLRPLHAPRSAFLFSACTESSSGVAELCSHLHCRYLWICSTRSPMCHLCGLFARSRRQTLRVAGAGGGSVGQLVTPGELILVVPIRTWNHRKERKSCVP